MLPARGIAPIISQSAVIACASSSSLRRGKYRLTRYDIPGKASRDAYASGIGPNVTSFTSHSVFSLRSRPPARNHRALFHVT